MELYKIAMFSYRHEKAAVSSDTSDDEADILKKIQTKKSVEDKSVNLQSMEVASEDTATTSTTTIPKRKVNHVWTTVMSENLLAEDLDQFALKMKHFKGNRSVESYDYTTANKFSIGKPELMKIFSGTQNITSTKDNKDFYKKHSDKKKVSFIVGKEEADKVSKVIAAKLDEPNKKLIYRTVRVLGTKKTLETLQSVEEIERNGGMKVLDGSRRRTPGGIYLYLLKTNPLIERCFKNYIFDDSYLDHKRLKKSQRKMNEKFQSKKKSLRKNSKKRPSKKQDLKPLPGHLELLFSAKNSDESLPTSGGTNSPSSSLSNSVSLDDDESEGEVKIEIKCETNVITHANMDIKSASDVTACGKTEMEQDSEIEDGEILD